VIAGHRKGISVIAAVCVAAAGLGGLMTGCGSGSKVSAASLKPRLLPASLTPRFHVLRTLDWSDPVNLVGEGIFRPEATHPSDAVKEVRSAGFRGAVGEELNRGGAAGEAIRNGVVKFKSASGAKKVRDWMHRQDLRQPCFAKCIFSPRNLAIPGAPGAEAVRQVPSARPPSRPPPGVKLPPGVNAPRVVPGAGPPTRYLVEFTVGPYLYFVWTEGNAAANTKFVAGAKQYYDRVKKLGAG
jgi:hypothetical protein